MLSFFSVSPRRNKFKTFSDWKETVKLSEEVAH